MTATGESELQRARALAHLLDAAFVIPGTRIRVGLDAIIGLIPGFGDIAGAAIATYIVTTAVRSGVAAPVIWQMLGNVVIDATLGSIPVLGDVFDVAFKANLRNADLLARYAEHPAKVTKRSRMLVAAIITAIALLLLGLITLAVLVTMAVWRLLVG